MLFWFKSSSRYGNADLKCTTLGGRAGTDNTKDTDLKDRVARLESLLTDLQSNGDSRVVQFERFEQKARPCRPLRLRFAAKHAYRPPHHPLKMAKVRITRWSPSLSGPHSMMR